MKGTRTSYPDISSPSLSYPERLAPCRRGRCLRWRQPKKWGLFDIVLEFATFETSAGVSLKNARCAFETSLKNRLFTVCCFSRVATSENNADIWFIASASWLWWREVSETCRVNWRYNSWLASRRRRSRARTSLHRIARERPNASAVVASILNRSSLSTLSFCGILIFLLETKISQNP